MCEPWRQSHSPRLFLFRRARQGRTSMQGSHHLLTVARRRLAVVSAMAAGVVYDPTLSILALGVLALLGMVLLGALVLLGRLLFSRRSAPARRLQHLLENIRNSTPRDHHRLEPPARRNNSPAEASDAVASDDIP